MRKELGCLTVKSKTICLPDLDWNWWTEQRYDSGSRVNWVNIQHYFGWIARVSHCLVTTWSAAKRICVWVVFRKTQHKQKCY